ncbi:LysR family transcriptional regulator [Pseudoalteromonas sp. T1lg75]|uniref:LysR family transcriptional regulator n=1 Tax=Pseudoalteromonas sp. T1lg75 TaxID=2077102 RepID=UPI000CF67646|nr:LysR family transcriptional regulator [Pseudoalteromonas sp. T1lg75]
MDTTSRLIMLLEVVEQGSFSKAAAMRNIDRSVISKQISKLEDELGVRLLNRTTRSFSLTAAGAEMVKKARDLRLLLTDTVQLAENYHQEPRGLLRIATSHTLGRRYIQPVINDFQKRFPQVNVDMRLGDRPVDMISEGYDLAFRIGEPRDSSLIARKVARNRMLLLASPEFIATYGNPQSIEELGQLPAATYATSHTRLDTINYINAEGEECEQVINAVYTSNDGEVILDKVISGTAFCLVPAFLIENEIRDGLLTPLLHDVNLPDYGAMYALYPHRDLPVRTRLLLDAVRHYIGDPVPRWELNIPELDSLYKSQ